MGEVLAVDVAAAERLSRVMYDSGQVLVERAAALTGYLDSVAWTGGYADGFRERWHGPVRQRLDGIVGMLEEAGQLLADHAQLQRQVSDGDGLAGVGVAASGVAATLAAQGRAARQRPPQPPVAQLGGVDNGQRYVDLPDGERRVGGDRAWRNNNPGNLVWNNGDTFARDHGAIGRDFRDVHGNHMAVFPDRATGERAQEALLQTTYGDRSISQMLHRYAPPHIDNTEQYIRNVTGATGLDRNTVINTLDENQFRGLVRAMQAQERENAGTIVRRP